MVRDEELLDADEVFELNVVNNDLSSAHEDEEELGRIFTNFSHVVTLSLVDKRINRGVGEVDVVHLERDAGVGRVNKTASARVVHRDHVVNVHEEREITD
jgi:hypothetical protein